MPSHYLGTYLLVTLLKLTLMVHSPEYMNLTREQFIELLDIAIKVSPFYSVISYTFKLMVCLWGLALAYHSLMLSYVLTKTRGFLTALTLSNLYFTRDMLITLSYC